MAAQPDRLAVCVARACFWAKSCRRSSRSLVCVWCLCRCTCRRKTACDEHMLDTFCWSVLNSHVHVTWATTSGCKVHQLVICKHKWLSALCFTGAVRLLCCLILAQWYSCTMLSLCSGILAQKHHVFCPKAGVLSVRSARWYPVSMLMGTASQLRLGRQLLHGCIGLSEQPDDHLSYEKAVAFPPVVRMMP